MAGVAVLRAAEHLGARRDASGLDRSRRLAAWCGGLALLPDVDFVLGAHRMYTHSAGAILAVAAAIIMIGRVKHWNRPTALGIVGGLAYGSHILLDWLAADQSLTPGLMALWPLSSAHVLSGVDLFLAPSWSYWDPAEFFNANLRYFARELIVILPLAVVLQLGRTSRTPNLSRSPEPRT
jgi:membrane-bound metal-dependent hydrolase YbcI (DUF457 family)